MCQNACCENSNSKAGFIEDRGISTEILSHVGKSWVPSSVWTRNKYRVFKLENFWVERRLSRSMKSSITGEWSIIGRVMQRVILRCFKEGNVWVFCRIAAGSWRRLGLSSGVYQTWNHNVSNFADASGWVELKILGKLGGIECSEHICSISSLRLNFYICKSR